jgi:hypothetical protein
VYTLSSHSQRAAHTRRIKELCFKLAFREGLCTVELRKYTQVVNLSSGLDILLRITKVNVLQSNRSVNTVRHSTID